MKITKPFIYLFLVTALLSCSDDDNTTNDNNGNTPADFAILAELDLSTQSGVIATFDGTPEGILNLTENQTSLQLSNARLGGRIFDGALYRNVNDLAESGLQKYEFDANGNPVDAGFIAITQEGQYGANFWIVNSSKGYYYDQSRGFLKIQIFNPTSMERTGEIDLAPAVSKIADDPTIQVEKSGERMMIVRDGKLFVDVAYLLEDDVFTGSAYDSAFVAVIDVTSDSFENLTEYQGAQGVSFPPLNMNNVNIDENGDLYIATMGDMFSGERNAKILRIRNGETSFDQDFELDIEPYIPGDGIKWYVGGGAVRNNILYTYIMDEPYAPDYSNYTDLNKDFYAIDINTKVATLIPEVPKTDFECIATPYFVGNTLYIPYSSPSTSGIYTYDGTEATSLFELNGGVIQGFFGLQ